jgi:hypothetical protein
MASGDGVAAGADVAVAIWAVAGRAVPARPAHSNAKDNGKPYN